MARIRESQFSPPDKLYKYRPLSMDARKEILRERLSDILLNDRLYFPTRLEFNDPFDCRIPISWDGLTMDEMERKLLEVYRRKPPVGLRGSVEDYVKERCTDGSIEELTRTNIGRQVTEDRMNKLRVLCLCECPDNILMWSHYGNNHEGVCLEFSTRNGGYFSGAVSVKYSEIYPRLNVAMDSISLADGMIRTKAASWAYEREWRIINQEADSLHFFPSNCLSGVVLGCQIASENEDLMVKVLSQRRSPVTLYRAIKASGEFALRVEAIRVVGPPLM